MKRWVFGVAALALLLAGVGPLHAGPISDVLTVFDRNGNIFAQVTSDEANEDPGQIFSLPSNVTIDPNQFGNATVLTETSATGQVLNSDIFGVASINGQLLLSFASDSETTGVNFGAFPLTFTEVDGNAYDATMYLSADLQAQGFTASFVSDPVPEPASLTLLGIGLAGIAGCGLRMRKRLPL